MYQNVDMLFCLLNIFCIFDVLVADAVAIAQAPYDFL